MAANSAARSCDDCGRSFGNAGALANHLRLSKVCGESNSSSSSSSEDEGGDSACQGCGKTFAAAQVHMDPAVSSSSNLCRSS